MPNVIASIGYGQGKLHTGLIKYLCDLWNSGDKQPLEAFFSSLGIPLDGVLSLELKPEHKGIDLVIRAKRIDEKKHGPFLVIEMKVDDHEHKVKKKIDGKTISGPQTTVYQLLEKGKKGEVKYLFITLGAGQYFRGPQEGPFEWVKLEKFAEALDAIQTQNGTLLAWREAVHTELELQERAFDGDLTRRNEYRSGTRNLYLLGSLKEQIDRLSNQQPWRDEIRAYLWGSRPDTILNFGQTKRKPFFMEVNSNGTMNLKVRFDPDADRQSRMQWYQKAQEFYCDLLGEWAPECNRRRGFGKKTKTLMSFEFGLQRDGKELCYKDGCSLDGASKHLLQIVEKFYSSPVFKDSGSYTNPI